MILSPEYHKTSQPDTKFPSQMNQTSDSTTNSTLLYIGDHVVYRSSQERKSYFGVLKFIGPVEFRTGIWAGVYLDAFDDEGKPQTGRNDGSVNGIRYFRCPESFGIFVPAEKISKQEPSREKPLKVPDHQTASIAEQIRPSVEKRLDEPKAQPLSSNIPDLLVHKLQNEVRDAQQQVHEQRIFIEELEQEKTKLASEMAKLRATHRVQVNDVIESKDDQERRSAQQIEDLRRQCQQIETLARKQEFAYKERMELLVQEIESLRKDNSAIARRLSSQPSNEDRERLVHSLQSQIRLLQEQLEKNKADLSIHMQGGQCDQLACQYEQVKEKLDNLNHQYRELFKAKEDCEAYHMQQLARLQSEFKARLTEAITAKDKQIRVLEQRAIDLQEELLSREEESLSREEQQYEIQNSSDRRRSSELENELSSMKKQIEDLHSRYEHERALMNKQASTVRIELAEKCEEIKYMQNQMFALSSQAALARDDANRMAKDLDVARDQIAQYKEDYSIDRSSTLENFPVGDSEGALRSLLSRRLAQVEYEKEMLSAELQKLRSLAGKAEELANLVAQKNKLFDMGYSHTEEVIENFLTDVKGTGLFERFFASIYALFQSTKETPNVNGDSKDDR